MEPTFRGVICDLDGVLCGADPLQPLPGATIFVAECRRRGMKIAIASKADRMTVEERLEKIGLPASRFDAIVTGDEVGHNRPHPELLIAAARRLYLEVRSCLMVEASVDGVRAAKAAGARCLALPTCTDRDRLRDAGADYIARDLAHVRGEVLEGWTSYHGRVSDPAAVLAESF